MEDSEVVETKLISAVTFWEGTILIYSGPDEFWHSSNPPNLEGPMMRSTRHRICFSTFKRKSSSFFDGL